MIAQPTPLFDAEQIARDRVIDAAVALFCRLPLENTRVGHPVGGSALQNGLGSGWIGYDLMVSTRRTERVTWLESSGWTHASLSGVLYGCAKLRRMDDEMPQMRKERLRWRRERVCA